MQLAFSKMVTTCAKSGIDFKDKSLLLQVSGGPDSIFLLYAIYSTYGKIVKSIQVVTIDFGYRDKESKEDSDFVKKVCDDLKLNCTLLKANFSDLKQVQKKARAFRLSAVAQIMETQNIDYTLLGHNRDDLLETLFLKLNRGAGVFSLSSFGVRKGKCIRPLIYYSKSEIEMHLHHHHILYRVDSSNLKNIYKRNLLRNSFFKQLDNHFIAWRKGFEVSYHHLMVASNFLKRHILNSQFIKVKDKKLFLTSKFLTSGKDGLKTEEQLLVLKLYLEKVFKLFGLNSKFLSQINQGFIHCKYAEFNWDKQKIICENGLLYQDIPRSAVVDIKLNQEIRYNDLLLSLHKTPIDNEDFLTESGIEKNKVNKKIYFSSQMPIENLLVRSIESGDRIHLPKVGNKKLNLIFKDAKIPKILRKMAKVFEVNGDIIAVLLPDIWLFNFFKKYKGLNRHSPFFINLNNNPLKEKYQYSLNIKSVEL